MLDLLTVAILSGTKMAREAMSDLLKFTFNLLLHYPKVCLISCAVLEYLVSIRFQIVDCEPQTAESGHEHDHKVLGDFWSSKLDGCVCRSVSYIGLRLMDNSLQTSTSSSTHIFYATSNFP
jgi:hypothetical protein